MNTTYATVNEVTMVLTALQTAASSAVGPAVSAVTTPNNAMQAAETIPIRPAKSFLTPTVFSWINPPYYTLSDSNTKTQAVESRQDTAAASPVEISESAETVILEATPEFAPDPVQAVQDIQATDEAVCEFAPQPVQDMQESYQAVPEIAPEAGLIQQVQEVQEVHEVPEVQEVPEIQNIQELQAVKGAVLPTQSATASLLEGFDLNKLAPQMLDLVNESQVSHVQKVISFFQKGGDGARTFGKIFLNDLALQRTVLAGLMNEPGNPLSHVEFLHKELALRLAACAHARQVAQLLLADI